MKDFISFTISSVKSSSEIIWSNPNNSINERLNISQNLSRVQALTKFSPKNSTMHGVEMPDDYSGTITFDGAVEKAGLGKDIKIYVGKNATLIPKGNDVHIKIVREE